MANENTKVLKDSTGYKTNLDGTGIKESQVLEKVNAGGNQLFLESTTQKELPLAWSLRTRWGKDAYNASKKKTGSSSTLNTLKELAPKIYQKLDDKELGKELLQALNLPVPKTSEELLSEMDPEVIKAFLAKLGTK